jgi:hypothetical protein
MSKTTSNTSISGGGVDLSQGLSLPETTNVKIGNTEVLNVTTLGSSVVNSNLTTVGDLYSLHVVGSIDSDNEINAETNFLI